MADIHHLTPRIPRATIRCLTTLLEKAQAGKITGVAFIALLPHGFIADACGEAHNAPEVVRKEMLPVLDAVLAKKARKPKETP